MHLFMVLLAEPDGAARDPDQGVAGGVARAGHLTDHRLVVSFVVEVVVAPDELDGDLADDDRAGLQVNLLMLHPHEQHPVQAALGHRVVDRV